MQGTTGRVGVGGAEAEEMAAAGQRQQTAGKAGTPVASARGCRHGKQVAGGTGTTAGQVLGHAGIRGSCNRRVKW